MLCVPKLVPPLIPFGVLPLFRSRCAGADTPGAVDCTGKRLGVMEPFEGMVNTAGLPSLSFKQ